jgi:hypothetical protein
MTYIVSTLRTWSTLDMLILPQCSFLCCITHSLLIVFACTVTATSVITNCYYQEGISSEASSLAGHLGLGKLIMFYDDNQVTYTYPSHMTT